MGYNFLDANEPKRNRNTKLVERKIKTRETESQQCSLGTSDSPKEPRKVYLAFTPIWSASLCHRNLSSFVRWIYWTSCCNFQNSYNIFFKQDKIMTLIQIWMEHTLKDSNLTHEWIGRRCKWCKKSIWRIDTGILIKNNEINMYMEAKLVLLQCERGNNWISTEQDTEHIYQWPAANKVI